MPRSEVDVTGSVAAVEEDTAAVVYHIAWTHYLFLVCAAAVMAIVGWQTYTFNGTCVPIPCHIYGAGSAVVAVLVLAVMLPAACCARGLKWTQMAFEKVTAAPQPPQFGATLHPSA
jgi:hypothetical protein